MSIVMQMYVIVMQISPDAMKNSWGEPCKFLILIQGYSMTFLTCTCTHSWNNDPLFHLVMSSDQCQH